MYTEISLNFSNEGTREDLRKRLVNIFLDEKHGEGSGDLASKYKYFVEVMQDGNRVYLQRPAFMYNGFDFRVGVENVNFAEEGKRRNDAPSHKNLLKDLELKKQENYDDYVKLVKLIKKVYECHDVNESEYANLCFKTGFTCEYLIKIIKWLFIEQDIRFWNQSGRKDAWEFMVPDSKDI